MTLQNGFIGPLDYKFMYLVHATPPYNCDLELGQNHYIKWHFCSFQINFLLCLVYKLVKKHLIGDTLTIISPPKKESVKNMRLSCCVEMPHSELQWSMANIFFQSREVIHVLHSLDSSKVHPEKTHSPPYYIPM